MAIQRFLGVVLVAIAVLVGIAVAGFLFFFWTSGPPLRVSQGTHQLIVDVQTLGEYPTAISRIRITDLQANSVVWEVVSEQDSPEFHSFTLVQGANPVQQEGRGGRYRVVTPSEPVFLLHENREYLIEAWGVRGHRSTAEFSF